MNPLAGLHSSASQPIETHIMSSEELIRAHRSSCMESATGYLQQKSKQQSKQHCRLKKERMPLENLHLVVMNLSSARNQDYLLIRVMNQPRLLALEQLPLHLDLDP